MARQILDDTLHFESNFPEIIEVEGFLSLLVLSWTAVLVDTLHFKGNFPESIEVEGMDDLVLWHRPSTAPVEKKKRKSSAEFKEEMKDGVLVVASRKNPPCTRKNKKVE